MQSIYWVRSWACHRKCPHCYDNRFRPYVRDALRAVVGEGQAAWPRVLANLPDRMRWVDTKDCTQPTTLILAGGELLIDGVREELFYPVLAGVRDRWGPRGRAGANGLLHADYETNFCARWSGAKSLLEYGHAGSEVAIEPDGSLYPCRLKTQALLGNLTKEWLTDILDDLATEPAIIAIKRGDVLIARGAVRLAAPRC